ncbi:MAG: ribulose-phosphate 3-epimerase [Patescibacteria group bacterium]
MHSIPAILAFSSAEFESKLQLALSLTDEVQIDIMDGQFVENTTIQLADIVSLPKSGIYEAHLMVVDPVAVMPEIVRLEITRVVVHIESDNVAVAIERYKHRGIAVYLGINPGTGVEKLHPYITQIDGVLVMTVIPGFGGQELIPEALDKVRVLKREFPNLVIEVDGGVTHNTIHAVKDAGADAAVIGGAILKAADPKKSFEDLSRV